MTDQPRPTPFPHHEPIAIGGHALSADRIVELLGPMLSEDRRARIDAVVAARTFSVAAVFDGPYDRGNVSAVMRTAEGLGVGPMHVIETQEDFKPANRVTQGADKWLDIRRWKRPTDCMAHLKAAGYQICATELEASVPLDAVDFTRPTAVVFGNESSGCSQATLEAADVRAIIPMPGFSQSFNISVAAAITLYHAYRERRARLGHHGDLSPAQQAILRAQYYIRALDDADRLVAELIARER